MSVSVTRKKAPKKRLKTSMYWLLFFEVKIIIYRFERGEGRVQYPLCFIFLTPSGASGKQMMAYASSRNQGKIVFSN